MAEASAAASKAHQDYDHLVIFVHGIEGNPSNWDFAVNIWKEKFGHAIFVHCSHFNEYKTHDGVDVCGKRLAEEILEVKKEVTPNTRVKLSLVCHSLGGLVARYAIGLLYQSGELLNLFFPQNYITLATPHCGARRPERTVVHKILNFFIAEQFDESGVHLNLEDKQAHDPKQRPLLVILADPELTYWKGLHAFAHRTKYSNTQFDIPCPYPTSAITWKNPYNEHSHIKMSAKYPHIINQVINPPALPVTDAEKTAAQLLVSHRPESREQLAFIIENLSKLEWRHYDVRFSSPLAHIQIIGHPPIPKCDDVIRHCADHFNL